MSVVSLSGTIQPILKAGNTKCIFCFKQALTRVCPIRFAPCGTVEIMKFGWLTKKQLLRYAITYRIQSDYFNAFDSIIENNNILSNNPLA